MYSSLSLPCVSMYQKEDIYLSTILLAEVWDLVGFQFFYSCPFPVLRPNPGPYIAFSGHISGVSRSP